MQNGSQKINKNDEDTLHDKGGYISKKEPFWCIFNFASSERHPVIIQLSVHPENGHRVIITKQAALPQALSPKETTITVFTKL